MSHALSQCVDLELKDRSAEEIACAYRALCAALLLRTAMMAKAKTPERKVELDQKRTAMGWVGGGHGVVTFEDACEALDLVPDSARRAILAHARGGDGASINKVDRPAMSRNVPRRRTHVPCPADVAYRQIQASGGLAPGAADAAGNRNHTGRA